MGSKGQNSFFSEQCHVAYQIKGKHKCSNLVASILPQTPYPPPPPKGSTGQISTFLEHSHVAYQINGNYEMQQHVSKYFARRAPPPLPHYPRGWVQKVEIQLFQNMVMLQIKFLGIRKSSNLVANILPAAPLPPVPQGVKRSNSNVLLADPPTPPLH